MPIQSEQILENNLVEQLVGLTYSLVEIKDEAGLLANLKKQLEKHNKIELSDNEFFKVLNHLNKGNVFDRAKILRDRMQLTKDDGQSIYIEFFKLDQWCQNQFQVTHQVSNDGKFKNRYDVTILVNGLPLVQIELKKRGLELKEAFNQTCRYKRHSYWAGSGLFQFVQIFVISNGVNTKYYANNQLQALNFKQTFYWSDKENHLITQLEPFAQEFLEPCHISKMIAQYIVLNEAHKVLMVLRPYQYYATEAIIERVKTSHKNGYIWHTTGSGKTLTSFKTSQILIQLPKVFKVVFVVDRRDLDYQTIKEFNSFSQGSIDGTSNTNALVKQFTDDTKLIVTTIQKLNTAISKSWFKTRMERHREERLIFIFDECHRSQFGETHSRIKDFFTKAQMFGFTGTPIFAENSVKNLKGKRTTKDLFEECLHKYVITDAIKDDNVLKFMVEYIGRYKEKENSRTNLDFDSDNLESKELMDSPERIEKIANYIIEDLPRKTHNRAFNSIFCVSSIDNLIVYYELFKKLKEEGKHNFKIATIFSYGVNEDDKDATGDLPDDLPETDENGAPICINSHSRDKLEEYIGDYNSLFTTKFTTKDSESLYKYYNDISKRVKNREIDILLVVNMFLTGFDSPRTNTLFVDKNLKYHGLIQSFSRTNRILNEQKSQGNIVCFRNLKANTDEAVALFSNKNAREIIFDEPYENYKEKFTEAVEKLYKIAPTVDSVNELQSETDKLHFVQAFREIMRVKNVLTCFADFDWSTLNMDEQTFNDYKSKYLDLYRSGDSGGESGGDDQPTLNDVDFELELIHRDEINVAYILALLARMVESDPEERERRKKELVNLVAGEINLRPKKELIEKFINENLPVIENVDDIPSKFESFWQSEQDTAFKKIVTEEGLKADKLDDVLQEYLFSNRQPLRNKVVEMLEVQPKLMERRTIVDRILSKLSSYIEVFVNNM
jgi:type I restriction enzyme R subunit